MTKLSCLEVPLVQEDLKYPDTILQIANTLDMLEQAVGHVFSHVRQSIENTTARLKSIEARNEYVNEKIGRLRSMNKAVTILSKSKYPYDVDTAKNYTITFQPPPLVSSPLTCEQAGDTQSDMESKLTFYHVKTATHEGMRRNVDVTCDEGLGHLPRHVTSITSCFLFNTCDNVYDKYVITDPLTHVPSDEVTITSESRKMQEAPKSLLLRGELVARQPYAYTPCVEVVPVIELPANLPDLMDFAQDFRYEEIDPGNPTPTPPSTSSTVSTLSTVEFTDEKLVPPSAPVPDTTISSRAPDSTSLSEPVTTMGITTPPSANVIPPSPPMPPPPPPPAPPTIQDPGSLHSNLMAAIRTAGGTGKAKLRSVAQETPAANTQVPRPPGGDLMSDLAAKLSLRRKGISGTQLGGSLMDKLLLNIPPPPVGPDSESDSGSNEEVDWED